ncbi:arylsulfatase [Aggregatimonas sangjinii]|uniref:Arylsulfatase n=1 Tax=Aggregatimonas sangjinii TaxID=2583587 RepID=A0A5B7SQ45_9FLAO|nr:arylsulfatase [Aggregatimonas sangjinii]QCW99518.1 arylsulfatase [Aggregatimonas sangjinii]
MRISFSLSIGLLVLLISCKENTSNTALTSETQKPNVILIMSDDQGWGDLSINGNSNLNTPNIDAIAENGVTLENFYVQPVCSPTRAEILTGRYASRLGVYATSAGGERMNLGETTIAEVFKANGYHTAAFGKWHNGMQPPYHPNTRGFDDFYGFASGHWGNYFSPILEHNGLLVRGDGFLTDDLTNRGIHFIEKHKSEPFFLYLPFNTPHSPMQVPDIYWEKFKNKELTKKYTGVGDEEPEFTKAALAMVENIDGNVGRIMEKIRALGLEENTIVLFMSDNGPNSWRWNGGMRGRKGSTDEGGVRSPFFIQWKDVLPAGTRRIPIASSVDLLPTLADLAGIPLETQKPLDGKSLKPLLVSEEENKWDSEFVFNHWNGKTSVRSQNYRLDAQDRLYDITKDRGQTTDIATRHPKMRDSLKKIKSDWLADVKADLVVKGDRPFTLGHPDHEYTQIPARDGIPHGNIKRSNRYPNDTFFTNWISVTDSISWDVEVMADGKYEVSILYTMPEGSQGMAVELSHGKNLMMTRIMTAHDPTLTGMENDRVPRIESYVKNFKPKILGTLYLRKGRRPLVLKTRYLPEKDGIDVRLLFFKRVD